MPCGDSQEVRTADFARRKLDVLSSIYSTAELAQLQLAETSFNCAKYDKSLKGSVDVLLRDVCWLINRHPNCYTTSTCSGRVQIYTCYANEAPIEKRKNVGYIAYACHKFSALIPSEKLLDRLDGSGPQYEKSLSRTRNAVLLGDSADLGQAHSTSTLIFEPLLLHVKTRTLSTAFELIQCARIAGIKNVGITGFKQRVGYQVCINGEDRLSVPVKISERDYKASRELLEVYLSECEKLFKRNTQRITKFFEALSSVFKIY